MINEENLSDLNPETQKIPDYQSLMLPLLKLAQHGETKISLIIDKLANDLALSEETRKILISSGRQTLFANRLHWAKTYLVKAGLLESKRRGYFNITQRGKEILAENPESINNVLLQRFEEFRQFIAPNSLKKSETPLSSPMIEPTPDETILNVYQKMEAALAQELLNRTRLVSPQFFELLLIDLLLAMGYGGSKIDAGRALGKSGDNGVDGVIKQDELGLDQIYIQAKRYAEGNNISSAAIRDFFGSLDRHKAIKGVFVTTSSFTKEACETAKYLSKNIILIDGEQLARLMIRHNIGCRITESLNIHKIDEDFFE